MLSPLLVFAASVVVIVGSGITLTRCADAIADHTGWGRLLIGSVFLAAATSLPELMIGLNSVWLEMPDVACGNLIGSGLFNLLILAVVDLSNRSAGGLLTRVATTHALSGAVTIALTSVVGMGVLLEPQLNGMTFLRLGPASIAVLVAYVFGIRMIFLDQLVSTASDAARGSEEEAASMSLPMAIFGYILAAAVIFATAPFLASSAGKIAEISGLGGTFIGTTLVAIATSLPELVATLAALRMGAADLAIGNVFGSNAINMLMLVPIDLAFPGALLANVSQTHALTCFAVTLITSIVILGQLYRVEKRRLFIEPDAGLVITLVFVALWIVYVAG